MPDKPFVWRRFRWIDTRVCVDAVADALEIALRKHPAVRDSRWWLDSKGRG
jgi:hypothetical protein